MTIKSKVKDLFSHLKNEIRKHIPRVEKIEEDVYLAFMDGFHNPYSYFPHKNPIEMRCFLRFYLKK